MLRPAHEPSDRSEVPTSADAVAVQAADRWFVIDRLPSEVRRSLYVFVLRAPTVELRQRRSALVRELVTHLVEEAPPPTIWTRRARERTP